MQYIDMLKALNEELDGIIDTWLEDCLDALSKYRVSWHISSFVAKNCITVPERFHYYFYDKWREYLFLQRYRELHNTKHPSFRARDLIYRLNLKLFNSIQTRFTPR